MTEETDRFDQMRDLLASTTLQSLPFWMMRLRSNFNDVINGKDFQQIPREPEGSAVIVSGGPSLARFNLLERLRETRYEGSVIAVDRRLNDCLTKQVVPRFVCSCDSGDGVEKFFDWKLLEAYQDKIKAVFGVVSPPQVIRRWRGEKYWCLPILDSSKDPLSITMAIHHLTRITIVDSVPYWSPLIVREANNTPNILTIEELWNRINSLPERLPTGEEIKSVDGYTLYSTDEKDLARISIQKIIRHLYQGEILRIAAKGAIVDVTPNHSIYRWSSVVDARTIRVGDHLDIARLKPHYNRHATKGFFVGTEDLAWLYGFFVAEGCANRSLSRRNEWGVWNRDVVMFSNKDLNLLEKAKTIFECNFNSHTYLEKKEDCDNLQCGGHYLYEYFKRLFYTHRNEKMIPSQILFAPERIQKAFLRGYNDGDGAHYDELKWEFQAFSTKSPVLAQGLLYLLKSVSPSQSWNLHTREDKPYQIDIRINKSDMDETEKRVVKKIFEIPYEDYVYDLQTETGSFHTGVGPVRVHNTLGNVTGLAALLALYLGKSTLAFIGLDLSFPGVDRPEETSYWKDWEHDPQRETAFRKIHNPITNQDYLTELRLEMYNNLLQNVLASLDPKPEIWNCSQQGIFVGPHINWGTLEEFVAKHPK